MHYLGNINCHTISFLGLYLIYNSTCSITNTAKSLFVKVLLSFCVNKNCYSLINFERNADKSACFKLFLQVFYLSVEIVFRL